MEAIVFILIIVLSLISAGNKKKKQGAAKTGGAPAQPARTQPASSARAAIERALAAADRWDPDISKVRARERQVAERKAEQEEAREKARRRAAAAKLQAQGQPGRPVGAAVPSPAQGSSAADDEGCLGGSLPHGHEEGESREEHSRHIAAMEAREKAEAAVSPKDIDARQLRRAVVMSEVLGRPKALRRRAG